MTRPLLILALALGAGNASADELPPEIPAKDFPQLHAMFKPYPGEFAWRDEIPYLTSLQAAREKAAAEGKPILLWAAADGHPLTQS